MHWLMIIPLALMCVAGVLLSYSRHREAGWAALAFAAMSAVCGFSWGWAVKRIRDEDRIYWFSLIWDVVMLSIYYGLPPLVKGVRLTVWGWLGVLLVTIGIVVVKTAGLKK